ncbi:MAG: leucine-rich repeat protein [Bacteroidaceae bacterium]|nr:leucine-rich repeat protein [Bacteroidaceae bacterium]
MTGKAEGTAVITCEGVNSNGERVFASCTISVSGPFNGAINLPGTLEAENFDKGGEGITYHDSDAEDHGGTNYRSGADVGMDIVTGNGGYAVGWTAGGEWIEYTINVTKAGRYTYEAIISNGTTDKGGFSISLVGKDGNLTKLADVSVPSTASDWDNYQPVKGYLLQSLEAGSQIFRITITNGNCNIDKVKFDNAALVSSLSFSQTKQALAMKSSTTLQLNPAISPSTVSKDKLIWSSSNDAIASVSSAGLVTGKKEGTVTITCEGVNSNGEKVSASCTVPVVNAALVSSLSFSQPKQVLAMKQSTTLQLNPTISPSTVSKDELIWSSSNSNIASVSSSGLVTGKKEGTVTITCEGVDANGEKVTASCEVFVFNGSQLNINSISFVSPTEVLEYSASKKTLQLNPTISPSTISKESLAWSSSDEDIATVSGSGLVTGKEYGTTTITCSAVNLQGEMVTASCRVIVYQAGLIYVGNIFYGLDTSGYAFVTNCAGGIPSNVNKERHEYSGTINVSPSVTYDGTNYPVKAIGTYAFYNQPELQAVQIPTSVLTFEPSAFEKSKNLARVLFLSKEAGLISVGERAFYECSKLNNVVLPNSTQRIDREGFRHCSSLSNITLSNSLNYINEYAFADCPVLNNVVLPESLKSIQNAAFNNDAALSSITFPAALEGIGAAAFANCASLKEVTFNTTNYTMTIGADAFKGSNAINKVKVAHLDSWVSINFSNPEANPASISHRLYSTGGSEIIDADVPEGPNYVNNNVFYNCQNLKSVTLPSTIQLINDNIFYGCTSLTKVVSKATNPPYFAGVDDPTKMNNVFNAADLYVPDASVSSYSSDDWWKRFRKIKKQSDMETPTTRSPFNGTISLAGTLEAENFDKGGEGITYHDNDAENHGGTNYRSGDDLGVDVVAGNGGYAIGWTNGGEWAEYTVNVTAAGKYTFEAMVSNGTGDNGGFSISLVGNGGNLTKLADVSVPSTAGNWDNYQPVKGDLLQSLEAGSQIFRITITDGNCNIDKIKFDFKEDAPNEIEDVIAEDNTYEIYTLDGKPVETLQKGVNIIRHSNGTTQKIYVK